MTQSPAIMSAKVSNLRPLWEDRWSQPMSDDLVEAVPEHPRAALRKLMEGLDEFEGLTQQVIWYGEAWKWTIEYTLDPGEGEGITACYIVPNVATPLVCIPLEAPVLERLPLRRLSRVVRDGIRAAKCAVSIHWATWRPTSKAEAEALTDLVRRKVKISKELTSEAASAKPNGHGERKNGRVPAAKTGR